MAVTCLAWFDEDRKFAVAYADGELVLCSKNEYEEPVKIEAHQVLYLCGRFFMSVTAFLLHIFFIDFFGYNLCFEFRDC